jgi:hypothetical protein
MAVRQSLANSKRRELLAVYYINSSAPWLQKSAFLKCFPPRRLLVNSLVMATVDMNSVQFYQPPALNLSIRRKHSAMSSLTQAAALHSNADQILESYGRLEAGIVAILDKREDFGSRFETGMAQLELKVRSESLPCRRIFLICSKRHSRQLPRPYQGQR